MKPSMKIKLAVLLGPIIIFYSNKLLWYGHIVNEQFYAATFTLL